MNLMAIKDANQSIKMQDRKINNNKNSTRKCIMALIDG